MRIRPLSDLHLEFSSLDAPLDEADLTLLAGDIFTKELQLPSDLRDFFKSKHVIGIAGNHEFYKKKIDTYTDRLYEIYDKHNGIFLENDYVTILNDGSISKNQEQETGLRISGGTLWTDFKLLSGDNLDLLKAQAMTVVGDRYTKGVNDFRHIREAKKNYRRFKPLSAAIKNFETMQFLENILKDNFKGINYIMTHHAPTAIVLPDKKKNDVFSIAYASNKDDFIKKYQPDYWQFGHIHNPELNQAIENTKFISNARGYPGHESYQKFNIDKIIDIDIPYNYVPRF